MWDVESATGKGVLYVGHSKNETSKREIPLNGAAREVFTRCSTAATNSATTEPVHYIWCASQHHYYDSPKPAESERPQHGSRTAMLTGSKRPVTNTMFSEVPPNEAIHPRF